MNSSILDYAELARRLLALEGSDVGSAAGCAAAVGGVHQKLHYRMVPLIGVLGMRALFARSASVTYAAFPQCFDTQSPAQSDQRGSAELIVQRLAELEPRVAWAVAVALYANLLRLTSTLIGERLVMLVVQRAFPKVDETAKQESR